MNEAALYLKIRSDFRRHHEASRELAVRTETKGTWTLSFSVSDNSWLISHNASTFGLIEDFDLAVLLLLQQLGTWQ